MEILPKPECFRGFLVILLEFMLTSNNSRYFVLKLGEKCTLDPNTIWPYRLLLFLQVAKIAKLGVAISFNCYIKDHGNFIQSKKLAFEFHFFSS